MKLIFTNYPFSKQEAFIFGLENQDSVSEFLKLFKITSIDKNKRCKLPTENELKLLVEKIRTQELKNLLQKYAGLEILILPEKDDYLLPDEIHYAQQ